MVTAVVTLPKLSQRLTRRECLKWIIIILKIVFVTYLSSFVLSFAAFRLSDFGTSLSDYLVRRPHTPQHHFSTFLQASVTLFIKKELTYTFPRIDHSHSWHVMNNLFGEMRPFFYVLFNVSQILHTFTTLSS